MRINEDFLKRQIFDLCTHYLNDDDIVIGILRYGAHIPHLYQNVCAEKSVNPKKINLLLSHMLPFFPADFYKNKNFVLLDDTVYTGRELEKFRKTLIDVFEIPENNIRTAALLVHEDSPINTDFPEKNIVLENAEYIAWKEILGAMVARDFRPTERDHPLYFFEADKIEVGRFLDLLQNCGQLHSVGNWKSQIMKISLTIDSAKLAEDIALTGVELGSVYKIRIYWQQISNKAKFTVVPMGFPVVQLNEFIDTKSSQKLAKMIGLRDTFFEELCNSCDEEYRRSALFYFASRSISAKLLELFLKQIVPMLKYLGFDIKIINPKDVDGSVNYIFPNAYDEFYSVIFNSLSRLIETKTEPHKLPLSTAWKKLPKSYMQSQIDSLLPNPYKILGLFVKDYDTALWDGEKWLPNYDNLEKGIPFQDILTEFNDPMFVSKSLDYLLESGLLRARDRAIANDNDCFTRVFLPGGEYNAIRVSRIADILKYDPPFKFNPAIAEEEAIEIWGPD